jgi:hypothetical protein
MATLTGPGLVYLESLPLSRLADRIIAASGIANTGESRGIGGLLDDFLSGDK